MTDEQNGSSGTDQAAASGGQGDKPKDSVAYETHRKLLGEYKKSQETMRAMEERLAAIEKEKQEAHEAMLASKGEFKSLVELREKRIQELQARESDLAHKLRERDEMIQNAKKWSAFQAKLPAPLKRAEYATFVELDRIPMDESGKIDELALSDVVSEFVKNHGETLLEKSHNKMPNGAAHGGDHLSYADRLKRAKSTAELHSIMREAGRL